MALVGAKTFKNFIGGEWVDSASGETMEVLNPATGEVEQVSLSGFTGVSAFGDVSESTENIVVNGPSIGTCGPFGA